MATQLTLKDAIANRLQEIAEKQNRSLDEMVELLLDRFTWEQSPTPPEIPDYPPRPAWSLTDDDIEVPDDIKDVEGYRAAARAIAPKLYDKARAYWRKVGDQERLAFTDEELDKQFWRFDSEDVPRLKSEKQFTPIRPNPLANLIGLIDSDETDLSTTVHESVAQHLRNKYGGTD